jgi:hypothetical protein
MAVESTNLGRSTVGEQTTLTSEEISALQKKYEEEKTTNPTLAAAIEKIAATVPEITGQTTQADISMTPYSELTPAERKVMTQEEKTAYLEAARNEAETNASLERAASNPLYDFRNRPDAQTAGTKDYIVYYSWIGGPTTGEWKAYRIPRTEDNMSSYGARAIGGPTKASRTGSVTDANGLIIQPTPIKVCAYFTFKSRMAKTQINERYLQIL